MTQLTLGTPPFPLSLQSYSYLFARFFIKSYLGSSSSAATAHTKSSSASNASSAAASKLAAHHTDDLGVHRPAPKQQTPTSQEVTDEIKREATEIRASAVEAAQAASVRTRKGFERVKKVVD